MAEKKEWSNLCTQFNTCALTGAAAFFAGIPNAQIIVNGPLWCYFYALRYLEKNDWNIARRLQGTQPDNQAIVYGTEDCLVETLAQFKKNQPAILLIENSCAVSLIGDDIAGIAKKAELTCPIVCLDCGGLKGTFHEGYIAAAKACFEEIAFMPRNVEPKTVNLIGCTMAYNRGREDGKELKRLLEMCGYKVLTCLGIDSSLEEITHLTCAELNIVVHTELGLPVAEYLKDQYDIPFIVPPLPYGLMGTKTWLKSIQSVLPSNMNSVFDEIEFVEKEIFAKLNDIKMTWGDLWFDQVIVSAPTSVAIGISMALRREWADMGKLTVILQDTNSKVHQLEEIDQILHAEKDAHLIEEKIKQIKSGLVLGSSNEENLLLRLNKKKVMFSNIAMPICDELLLNALPFMGIRGTHNMLERIWNLYIRQLVTSK